jgi:hypothetical protein
VTLTNCPAIVNVPVRADAEVLAATEKFANPVPVMLVPRVTVIHDALLVVVHAQPLTVLTVTLPDPPAAGKDTVVVEREYAQEGLLKANRFDGLLWPAPPGPTASTRASSTVPGPSGHGATTVERST